MTSRLAKLLSSLVEARPGSNVAERLRFDGERDLMRILRRHGLAGVERAIGRLRLNGRVLDAEDESGPVWSRSWRVRLDDPDREVGVSVMDAGEIRTSSIEYRRQHRLSAREQRLAAVHGAFYARYDEVASRAYRAGGSRALSRADRHLLLVAELEAEVNNGGFRQYLRNKGRRRARSAVAALRAVGARRTQRMLEAALAPGASASRLARLDDRFCQAPEDLAALVMSHRARSRRLGRGGQSGTRGR
jgi:hypothetical protein